MKDASEICDAFRAVRDSLLQNPSRRVAAADGVKLYNPLFAAISFIEEVVQRLDRFFVQEVGVSLSLFVALDHELFVAHNPCMRLLPPLMYLLELSVLRERDAEEFRRQKAAFEALPMSGRTLLLGLRSRDFDQFNLFVNSASTIDAAAALLTCVTATFKPTRR